MSSCRAVQINAPVGCVNCGNCARDAGLVKHKGRYVDSDALDEAREAQYEAEREEYDENEDVD